MPGESIRVTRSVTLPLDEIELRFSRSSGPGGQHAQRTESRVEAIFDVESVDGADAAQQKRRVSPRPGPVLRAVAQDERSQWRNRELAVERLVEALRAALRVERRRRPTAPTAASRERGSSRSASVQRPRSGCVGHRRKQCVRTAGSWDRRRYSVSTFPDRREHLPMRLRLFLVAAACVAVTAVFPVIASAQPRMLIGFQDDPEPPLA